MSLLQAKNLVKQFGTFQAIDKISLNVASGEVLGLAGQSGAGKSLLCSILAGLTAPDSGQLVFEGQSIHWPFQAQKRGIGLIHQRPQIINTLDITGNIFIGRERFWPRLHNWRVVGAQEQMDAIASDLLARLEMYPTSLRQKAANLSREDRQMLAIARSLLVPVRMMIIDDPMRALSYHNQRKLLELIREWKQQGTAVIFSSNNLDYLFSVADHIVVMRHGRIVSQNRANAVDRGDVVSQMVGMVKNQELTPIIWALERYEEVRRQTETLTQDRITLERDLVARDVLNQQLITQLNQQMRALDVANSALQAAHRRLLSEREHERKRLARELHDQTIQDLLGLNYQLEEIGEYSELPTTLRDNVHDLYRHVAEMVDDLRRICSDLRPPTLDSLGLASALKSLAYDWAHRTNISLELSVEPDLEHLPESMALNVFRIIQETLNNVRKHASATQVHINLEHILPRVLMLSVRDNGQGLPSNFDLSHLSTNGHYGLVGISERVALLGGRLRMENHQDGGLLIQVELPYSDPMLPN